MGSLKIYKHIINSGRIENILVCHNCFKAICLLTHLAPQTNFAIKILGFLPAMRVNISLRKKFNKSIRGRTLPLLLQKMCLLMEILEHTAK